MDAGSPERGTRRFLWVGILLALASLLGAVLFLGGQEGDPSVPHGASARPAPAPAPAADDATLRGTAPDRKPDVAGEATPPRPSSPPAAGALQGVVKSTEGTPLEGATVFLLLEEAADAEPPRTTTDEEGRWRLPGPVGRGGWIGAVCEGHLPAHLGGDEAERRDAVTLELAPGPTVRATVADGAGGPLALDTTICVAAIDGAARWPAPGQPWSVNRDAVIPAGSREVTLRVGTRAPVEIRARYRNVMPVVKPDRVVREPPVPEIAFTVTPSCAVDLAVLDGATGEALDRGFWYELLQHGKLVTGGTTILPGGRLHMGYRLEPGTYQVAVAALGYRRLEGIEIDLPVPGSVAEVSARLERDPTLGHLRVSIPALADLPRIPTHEGTTRAPPGRFLWRRAGSSGWGGLAGEGKRESDTDYLFTYVPGGEVDGYVVEEVSGLVAFVTGIRIRAGSTDTITVDLQPGIRFDTSPFLPVDREVRAFHVCHAVHGELPIYALTPYSASWYEPGSVPGRKQRLGPYPGPELEVVVVDLEGTETKHTVRLEEE